MTPEKKKEHLRDRRLARKTGFSDLSSQYPYPVKLKLSLKVKDGERLRLHEWLKNQNLSTAGTFGVTADVLIGKGWQTIYFKRKDMAALFRLSWIDKV